MYRDSDGYWDRVRWDGQHATFFAIRETSEAAAREEALKVMTRRSKLQKRILPPNRGSLLWTQAAGSLTGLETTKAAGLSGFDERNRQIPGF